MTRTTAAVAALAAAAASASPVHAASPCTRAAAKRAIVSSTLLKPIWGTVRSGGGVDKLICHDLTGDRTAEMAVTIFSGGTAGDIAWVVFQRQAGRWQPVLRNLQGYKVGLFRVGTDLVESQAVYRKTDPNCCPSGGVDHRRFHWNGSRFVVVRRWHDARFTP